MRIALVGPLHPWRGGLAQYLGLLGEALMPRAEVQGVTFTRQYPSCSRARASSIRPPSARAFRPSRCSIRSVP
jgi:hypothetical protein